ncbi:antitoxin Xre/MbcA/ParS toxin-binding domain-containing protein [Pseudomonas koreensis]|uniref:antitoxin Xre/MbcA/ParS toxin-binding domain-containing protein n=1 Tax=Pseudomonas koreensis TaxID=198620 RepID=UPI0037F3257C
MRALDESRGVDLTSAEHVFGNKSKADSWLNQPKTALGGSTPLKEAQKLSKNHKNDKSNYHQKKLNK